MNSIGVVRVETEAECIPVRRLAIAHARYERSDTRIPDDWGARVAGLIACGDLDMFVATAEGRPVGYATLTSDVATWTGERFGHLDCLFVDETARGAGVGRRLFDAVFERALVRGLDHLQWQTPSWNERATAFYERLGAQRSSKQRFTLDIRDRAHGGRDMA
ncbi:GNAT family N-acetyltransferase [Microbacterium sp. HJ5]